MKENQKRNITECDRVIATIKNKKSHRKEASQNLKEKVTELFNAHNQFSPDFLTVISKDEMIESITVSKFFGWDKSHKSVKGSSQWPSIDMLKAKTKEELKHFRITKVESYVRFSVSSIRLTMSDQSVSPLMGFQKSSPNRTAVIDRPIKKVRVRADANCIRCIEFYDKEQTQIAKIEGGY